MQGIEPHITSNAKYIPTGPVLDKLFHKTVYGLSGDIDDPNIDVNEIELTYSGGLLRRKGSPDEWAKTDRMNRAIRIIIRRDEAYAGAQTSHAEQTKEEIGQLLERSSDHKLIGIDREEWGAIVTDYLKG